MLNVKSLITSFTNMRRAWKDLGAFNQLSLAQKEFVFYLETAADWAFIGPIVMEMKRRSCPIVLICSDPNDSALEQPMSYFVGMGTPRTVLFRTIKAQRFIMTLPDIETFYLKRSTHPVHYFYVFHSIASSHRVYRLHAFDGYDTVFCVGPHHEREIRRMEEVYQLPQKRLLPHGYGRLDTLIHDLKRAETSLSADSSRTLRILLAPTWGDCSLIAHGLEDVIRILLDEKYHVTLRLHPMSKRQQPSVCNMLSRKFEGSECFSVDPVTSTTQALLDADIMISEWSGAPIEYAFARLRPVIFVDTPPKVHNPEFDRLGLPCLEEHIRSELGVVLPLDQIDRMPCVIRELVGQASEWSERIRMVRDKTVYNVGSSGQYAAEAIINTSPPN